MNDTTQQRPEERRLEKLNLLEPTAERAIQVAAIREGLRDKHFRVVARAATLAEQRALRELLPDLTKAFARFVEDPVKKDPKCKAKGAIARALVNLECQDVGFFLEAVRYRQPEPVWGGSEDSAIDVRCSCAMGLIGTGYFRAVQELTGLLADPEWRARVGAARAISCGNPLEAEAVLRLKVLVGDEEPEVIGECFLGMLAGSSKEHCLSFVAGYLSDPRQGVRDFAALALGESHHPLGFEYLRTAWDEGQAIGGFGVVLIRAAALHKTEPAFDWLVSIIEEGSQTHADAAVESLSVYERNTRLMQRVQAAVTQRSGPIS